MSIAINVLPKTPIQVSYPSDRFPQLNSTGPHPAKSAIPAEAMTLAKMANTEMTILRNTGRSLKAGSRIHAGNCIVTRGPGRFPAGSTFSDAQQRPPRDDPRLGDRIHPETRHGDCTAFVWVDAGGLSGPTVSTTWTRMLRVPRVILKKNGPENLAPSRKKSTPRKKGRPKPPLEKSEISNQLTPPQRGGDRTESSRR